MLLLVYILELFEIFDFSPLILLFRVHVYWRRINIENELPYAMLFLHQLLCLGIPLETALKQLRKQTALSALIKQMDSPRIKSDSFEQFLCFIYQLKKVGVTPAILSDLIFMSDTQKKLTLSRSRAMSNMANHLCVYLLTLYTVSIFIIVTTLTSISVGLEFLLLDLINPFLFVFGFLFLFGVGLND